MKPDYTLLYNLYNGEKIDNSKPVRNPTYRAVEFYVAHVLPKYLIQSENKNLLSFAENLFRWSNFNQVNTAFIRELALTGNLFLKISTNKDKAFITKIPQENIVSLEVNSRGYIQYIEWYVENSDNSITTEIWDKRDGYLYLYEHTNPNFNRESPSTVIAFEEIGIDFIPIVHIKFHENSEIYGQSCIHSCIQKIVEANSMGVRLHQLQFRYNAPLWKRIQKSILADGSKNAKSLSVSDTTVINLSEGEDFAPIIAAVDYNAALNILNSMMLEIENDLPELKYYQVRDTSLSGKGIKLLLQAALTKADEVRVNYIDGLVRLIQIAATISQFSGISDFIGKYPDGLKISLSSTPEDTTEEKLSLLKEAVSAGIPVSLAMEMLKIYPEFSEKVSNALQIEKDVFLSEIKEG